MDGSNVGRLATLGVVYIELDVDGYVSAVDELSAPTVALGKLLVI